MGKKLAIRGHSTRGKEVIELLEMLGGSNIYNLLGNNCYVYYANDIRQNIIRGSKDMFDEDIQFFNLEEFLEKYPFKVGDIVKTGKDEEGVIKQMRWVDNDIVYWVNSHKTCDWTQTLSVDVLDKYNRLNLNDIEYSMETKIESTGFMQLGKTFVVIFNDANYENEVELQLGDYEIEVRDGKTYAVKKKPKYPTIYEECCQHLGCDDKISTKKLVLFSQLINARNAYWKIAGEELGLGKPWEPDWSTENEHKYVIEVYRNNVRKNFQGYSNTLLAFPTIEMRDAFYENFKDLIEQCKELL